MSYKATGIGLWPVAAFLLWLTIYRPFTPSSGIADRVPARIGEYTAIETMKLTPRHHELLGTDDATWRTYQGADGKEMYVVCVFHQENWKSVHPPHLCLRGTDMQIVEDDALTIEQGGVGHQVGRIVTIPKRSSRQYVSLYAFCAPNLVTGSYLEFVLHHAPRALFRATMAGALVRVETYVDDGDVAAAERRCAELLAGVLKPVLTELER